MFKLKIYEDIATGQCKLISNSRNIYNASGVGLSDVLEETLSPERFQIEGLEV